MCIATLSDDSDIFSVFVFGLLRNQLAELDGSGRVGTCRNPMPAAGRRSRGDPKTRTGSAADIPQQPGQLWLFTHSPAALREDRLFFLSFFFFIIFKFRFSELPQPDGNRVPMSDAGDPATRGSPDPQKAASGGFAAAPPGGAGEKGKRKGVVVQFSPASAAGPREGSQGFSQEGGQGRAASSPGRPHLLSASNAALLPL